MDVDEAPGFDLRSRAPVARGLRLWLVAFLVGVGVVAALLGAGPAAAPPVVVALAVAGAVLASSRSARITIEAADVVVRNRLGFRDIRPVKNVLTVEWHERNGATGRLDRWWTRTLGTGDGATENLGCKIVLNFVDFSENISLRAAGFRLEEIRDLARRMDAEFVTVSL